MVTVKKTYGFISLFLALVLTIVTSGAASATPEVNKGRGKGVTAEEVSGALKSVPGLLDESKGAQAKAKGASLVLDNASGVVAEVPLDAKRGVRLGNGDSAMTIGIPGSSKSGKGHVVAEGTVAYSSTDSYASSVQVLQQGDVRAVRLLTVIEEASAPTSFDYPIDMPDGASIQMQSDGSAMVVGIKGETISLIGKPWAKDAVGKEVRTWYTTNGASLTQHVNHNVAGIAYPVVADPIVIWLMGVTLYCTGAALHYTLTSGKQKWWIWLWGMVWACIPL